MRPFFSLLRPGRASANSSGPSYIFSVTASSAGCVGMRALDLSRPLVVNIETCNSRGEDGGVGDSHLPHCPAVAKLLPRASLAARVLGSLRAAPIYIVMLSLGRGYARGIGGLFTSSLV